MCPQATQTALPELTYIATIRHGVDISSYKLNEQGGSGLVYFGDIHPDNGTREVVETALQAGRYLVIVGAIRDQAIFSSRGSSLI